MGKQTVTEILREPRKQIIAKLLNRYGYVSGLTMRSCPRLCLLNIHRWRIIEQQKVDRGEGGRREAERERTRRR